MPTGDRTGSPNADAGTDHDRMFPRLTPAQMDRLASHGRPRSFSGRRGPARSGRPHPEFLRGHRGRGRDRAADEHR